MIAFLFPGQGARNVLSGVRLARALPWGPKLLELATTVELEAEAGRALERTEVLQPVLVAVCLAIHHELSPSPCEAGKGWGEGPMRLGHSLGQLTAFAATGAISPEDAVKLAAVRGALMAREAAKHPGGLIALDSLEAANAALRPGIQLAAVNAPNEVVISGTQAALRGVVGHRVPVSGPWHSAAMAGAVEEFRSALKEVECEPPRAHFDGLADQLTQPVQFSAALKSAVEQGVDTFVTVGPGAVLRGLVRKNLGNLVRVLTTEDANDFERTVTALRELQTAL